VSGTDAAELRRSIEAVRRPNVALHEVAPTLEDVFIHMMRESAEPRAHIEG